LRSAGTSGSLPSKYSIMASSSCSTAASTNLARHLSAALLQLSPDWSFDP
jgi:hypothetical protein